jgi:PAS fold
LLFRYYIRSQEHEVSLPHFIEPSARSNRTVLGIMAVGLLMLVGLWAMVVVTTHSSRETALPLVSVASVMTLLVVGGAGHLIREIRQWAAHAVELQDAVDSISEAFVIYDRNDRFVACNEAYRRHIYPDTNEHLNPGTRFEDVVTHGVKRGKYAGAIGREEEWIAERVDAQRWDGRAADRHHRT